MRPEDVRHAYGVDGAGQSRPGSHLREMDELLDSIPLDYDLNFASQPPNQYTQGQLTEAILPEPLHSHTQQQVPDQVGLAEQPDQESQVMDQGWFCRPPTFPISQPIYTDLQEQLPLTRPSFPGGEAPEYGSAPLNALPSDILRQADHVRGPQNNTMFQFGVAEQHVQDQAEIDQPILFSETHFARLQAAQQASNLWPGSQKSVDQGLEPLEPLLSPTRGSGSVKGGIRSPPTQTLQQKRGDDTKGDGVSVAAAKVEKLKAKNKRAQKRFRQKQKDRQEELEREASELSEKLKQTQIELDTLTSTKKMLEIALTNTSHSQHKPASTKDEANDYFVPSHGAQAFNCKLGLSLEVLYNPPRKLTRGEIMKLSDHERSQIFKDFCQQVQALLDNGAEDVRSPQYKWLKCLINERHGYLAWNFINHAASFQRHIMDHEKSETNDDQSPPQGLLKALLAELGLSSEQKMNLLQAYVIFTKDRFKCLKERGKLTQELEGLSTDFKIGIAEKARAHSQWSETVQKLQNNLDLMHVVLCKFLTSVYSRDKGLSVIQEAKAWCLASRHWPNTALLMKELAASEPEMFIEVSHHQGVQDSTINPADNEKGSKKASPEAILKCLSEYLPGFIEKLD